MKDSPADHNDYALVFNILYKRIALSPQLSIYIPASKYESYLRYHGTTGGSILIAGCMIEEHRVAS